MTNKRLIAEITNGEQVIMTIDDNMLSCEFGALDRGNLTDVVNWGIYANRGSISFIDNVGYFNNQNVNSSEIKNYKVKFYLVKSQRSLIATFKIDSVDFEEETKIVNIELVSNIISLQKEKTTGSVYPFFMRLVSELLEYINDKCPHTKISIGEDSENITKTMIDCPYIGIDTVWNVLKKICQATMSRIVEKPSGELEITSSFPIRTPIIVEPKNIISIENNNFVRVKNASIDVTERNVFENIVLEGSSNSFSVSYNSDSLRFQSISGFTVTESYDSANGGYYQEYVKGTLKFKTPYKIFKIGKDQSDINENTKMGTLTANSAITEDKDYTRRSTMCENETIVDETDISATIRDLRVSSRFTEPESYFIDTFIRGGTIRFPVYTFVDNGTTTISITNDEEGERIESNDLIQNGCFRGYTRLGQYIIDEVKKRYSKGIECFEIECLFNSYYDEHGIMAYPTQDISQHFQKYDIIIPYVMKKGQRVPLRVNADGTPKKFRVIGISYSYDGLLRQKLSVQEERYDVD